MQEGRYLTGLLEILFEARRLGFLGPGPVEAQVDHALGVVSCLSPAEHRGLDLGSGGGLPGLVVAEARPEMQLVLLDSRRRCCRFLDRAVEKLGLAGRVEVLEARAEVAARRPDLRGTFDVVLARSFAPPAVTSECAVGFLRTGGHLVVSEPPASGDRWPSAGLERLGLSAPTGCGEGRASWVRLDKQREDERWPRRVGIPAKRPLWR